jgi:hypothetical protein
MNLLQTVNIYSSDFTTIKYLQNYLSGFGGLSMDTGVSSPAGTSIGTHARE